MKLRDFYVFGFALTNTDATQRLYEPYWELLVTHCRREGMLNLARRDVRPARQTVWLDEKNSARREQPVIRAMTVALQSEACPLYGLTRRKMDGVWTRVRRQVPWAEDVGVSSHWMRHYAISNIEQVAGYATAAAFAGHRLVRGATASYVEVGLPKVAAAFSQLWGEPHPAAPQNGRRGESLAADLVASA